MMSAGTFNLKYEKTVEGSQYQEKLSPTLKCLKNEC